MFGKWMVVTVVLCGSSGIGAEQLAIGSVIGQGELRVDSYLVKGGGTVFEGSVVETGSGAMASAVVRLDNGTEIKLYDGSRGVVHQDQFLLLRGRADLSASPSFRAQATGLVIRTSEPLVEEFIAIGPEGNVNVQARSGNLEIAAHEGSVLARVSPERPLAFSRGTDAQWRVTSAKARDFDRGHDRDGDDRDKDGDDHHHHRHPSR